MALILIAEHDEIRGLQWASVLRRVGYQTLTVATDTDALIACRQSSPSLVIADAALRSAGGVALLRRLRVEGFGGFFVLTTNVRSVDVAMEALRAGACDYLETPLSAERICLVVKTYIGGPGASRAGDSETTHVARAMKLIDLRFREERVRTSTLATEMGISAEHLSRLVKARMGKTITGLIAEKRVSTAVRLLTETSRSVKEITHAVGFRTATQFRREFGRVHGCLPTEYRRRRP